MTFLQLGDAAAGVALGQVEDSGRVAGNIHPAGILKFLPYRIIRDDPCRDQVTGHQKRFRATILEKDSNRFGHVSQDRIELANDTRYFGLGRAGLPA